MMISRRFLMLIASAIVMTGCAATVQKSGSNSSATPTSATAEPVVSAVSSKNVYVQITAPSTIASANDYSQIKSELSVALMSKLSSEGAKVTFEDAAKPISSAVGTRVLMTVKDYRIVSTGARIMLGIMMGRSFIDSNVEIFDLENGKRLAETDMNTSSSAWQGVLATTTSAQAEAIANEVTAMIKPRN
jgi:hypothetical protein